MNKRESQKSGFTLIELTFAIAFISVLLITITLITNEIISIYRKGYAMKAVNQVGRDLIDDFTKSITDSPPANIASFCNNYADATAKSTCEHDSGQKSIYQQFYAEATIEGAGDETKLVPIGGIFCTGKYSYIWNTGYALGNSYHFVGGDAPRLSLILSHDDSNHSKVLEPHLVRVEDASRAACSYTITPTSVSDASRDYDYNSDDGLASYDKYEKLPELGNDDKGRMRHGIKLSVDRDPTEVGSETYTELLTATDDAANLALYDFVVFTPAQVSNTNRLFYSASFILGTINGSVDIVATNDYCQTPETYNNADFSYCAVNKFNFSTQASGI